MALINKLSAIGNAIREKTGKTDLLTLDQMPEEIKGIETGGSDSYYDTFWDAYQNNGGRLRYKNAFYGEGWTSVTFKPKYDIKPTTAEQMFENSNIKGDLGAILKGCNVVLDTSKTTSLFRAFLQSAFTSLPTIDFSSVTTATNVFYYMNNLHTIEKLIVHRNITSYYMAFNGLSKLENITFEGEINASINFKESSKLTTESVNSIINALVKFEGTGTAPVLTLNATVKGKLIETQIATITTDKGWTLA